MNKITNLEKVLVIGILSLSVFCYLTKTKQYNYNYIEYKQGYAEKHPIIDTIIGSYENSKPILVRGNYKINGHDKIGVCTGGSQLWFTCSDDCKKCLSLQSE
tara:strand:- start:339 stop:644 length:306 start_codon:yes stop_codon:yes gene_type:complete